MEIKDYQQQAMTTCMPTSDNFSYMSLGLVGEMGEFTSKVAKAIRKGKITIKDDGIVSISTDEENAELLAGLQAELGDIMWFVSGLASVFGWSLEDVCKGNLDKLASRQRRNVIDGDGDNR